MRIPPENLTTEDHLSVELDARQEPGRYEVVAERGVTVNTEWFGFGETVNLGADAARALLADGAVRRVP